MPPPREHLFLFVQMSKLTDLDNSLFNFYKVLNDFDKTFKLAMYITYSN